MTKQIWKFWTPERDGHAPDDWVEGMKAEYRSGNSRGWEDAYPTWCECYEYRYLPLQDATYEPDLLAQCLALPQDQREALIEAMQKPQRDWADDVWVLVRTHPGIITEERFLTIIRSMCRPKEEPRT